MIDLTYPNILNLFKKHLDASKRSESASFLIWYLENYFRLDEIEAVDSVCDQHQDKGIDGIYYSESEEVIYIFQSKISQRPSSKIGDRFLREFSGTLEQFKTKTNIDILLNGNGNDLLKALIKRLNIRDIIENIELKGVFLTNIDLDSNGIEFLRHSKIQFFGKEDLERAFVSTERNSPIDSKIEFDLTGFGTLEYIIDNNTKCIVATIKAKELVKLAGIQNQSLFDLNVRGSLGKTKVNKDIQLTLKNNLMHKTFPLYHNGITIICNDAEVSQERLTINKYYVVNGCQSLTVLHSNSSILTDDLRVLVRIVKLDTTSDLAEKITMISNNQNGVKPRDFKSNHPIQVRLQNEIRQNFNNRFELEIKRGETFSCQKIISNEMLGLQLIAFDLQEPWTTHRKYQIFDDKYSDIFGRPEVNAFRIVFINKIFLKIEEKLDQIENRLFGQYVLTKYLILYIIRRLFDNDPTGRNLLKEPKMIFEDNETEAKFDTIIDAILGDVIIDINEETKGLDVNFDYRGKLRDKEYVTKFSSDIVSSYQKQIARKRVPSIDDEWNKQTYKRDCY